MSYTIENGEINTKQVEKFMIWGSPLNQAFVMLAIDNLANSIVEQKEELLKEANSLMSMSSWVKCATDWQECREIASGKGESIKLYHKGKHSHNNKIKEITNTDLKRKAENAKLGVKFEWLDINTGLNWEVVKF